MAIFFVKPIVAASYTFLAEYSFSRQTSFLRVDTCLLQLISQIIFQIERFFVKAITESEKKRKIGTTFQFFFFFVKLNFIYSFWLDKFSVKLVDAEITELNL